ncbi:hypothetical protein [Mesorhizobium sp.]|nr:hypothetical protein [Mesorhizobium sp.]RWK29811.1 MAG: hypothetical protein EOR40_26540 [Mesorhizobium sp.]
MFREFDDYMSSLLFGSEVPETLKPERLSPGDLRREVARFLRVGQPSKRISIAKGDILAVQSELLRLLERAETAAGRDAVALAYAGNGDRLPLEAYRRDRHRYAHPRQPGPLDLNARLRLAGAACALIREHVPDFDADSALLRILGPSSISYVRYSTESESLLDSGRMLSDAWLEIAHALDEELGLSSWFALREEPVADPGGVVAELLGAETAALPPAHVGEDLDAESFEEPRYISGPEPAYLQEYNFMRSPHDEALAPAVRLFMVETRSATGRLADTYGKARSPSLARIRFWREVTLQLLPCTAGGILPCLAFVPKVSLADRGGNPIPLRSPFTRPIGETPRVPLLLSTADDLTWFRPDDPAALSDGRFSDDTSYQTTWMAAPGAVAIAMRMMADDECRPVDRAIIECAKRGDGFPSQFALGTIGNVVEKATFIPDRADGIGALLRADFQRRDSILRAHGIMTDAAPWPSRFHRTWSHRG